MNVVIRHATILTMNDGLDVVTGDVWIEDGRIAAVGQVNAAWIVLAAGALGVLLRR